MLMAGQMWHAQLLRQSLSTESMPEFLVTPSNTSTHLLITGCRPSCFPCCKGSALLLLYDRGSCAADFLTESGAFDCCSKFLQSSACRHSL